MNDIVDLFHSPTPYLTLTERASLHKIIYAMFLPNSSERKFELLHEAHLQIENPEDDLEMLDLYGSVPRVSLQ